MCGIQKASRAGTTLRGPESQVVFPVLSVIMLSALLSSLIPTAQTEAAKEDKPEDAKQEAKPEGEAEEEEEPEDPHGAIREECNESASCRGFTEHFRHCQERVEGGDLKFKGETCVEELFHMMHCADKCAAPRLFAKLK